LSIQLSAQEHMLVGDSLSEKFEFAQSVGFAGIELRGSDKFADRIDEIQTARRSGVVMPTVCVMMDHFIGDFDADRRAHARESMKALLTVIAEAGGFGAITPASYGMFSLRLPPFTPPRSAAEDRDILLEELHALGEHAAHVGAVLLLEPLNRYEDHMVHTLAEGLDLVREVGLPSVRLMADTYHMNIEEADVSASLREAAPFLSHVQIGDSNRLEPGTGHFDWPGFIQTLADIHYDGWIAMECRLSGPSERVLPHVSRLFRELGVPM
jgi:sugar phosphate isomerase/epimerase